MGHFGVTPLTFLVVLPLKHVIVLLVATLVPVNVIFAVVEIGAMVGVPTWVAVIEQLPACNRFRTDPEIVQTLIGVLV